MEHDTIARTTVARQRRRSSRVVIIAAAVDVAVHAARARHVPLVEREHGAGVVVTRDAAAPTTPVVELVQPRTPAHTAAVVRAVITAAVPRASGAHTVRGATRFAPVVVEGARAARREAAVVRRVVSPAASKPRGRAALHRTCPSGL
jgi:hypothetical protein